MPKSTLTGVSWARDAVPPPSDPVEPAVEVEEPAIVVDEHGDDAAAVAEPEPAAEKPRRRAR